MRKRVAADLAVCYLSGEWFRRRRVRKVAVCWRVRGWVLGGKDAVQI